MKKHLANRTVGAHVFSPTSTLLLPILLLAPPAYAQTYKCLESYAAKDGRGERLSNAVMAYGEMIGSGAMHGDVEQVKGGTDIRYNFPGGGHRWLVCQYGGTRVGETAISAAQIVGGRQSWMRLDPFLDSCDLKIRQVNNGGKAGRAWTATAICKGAEVPPPVMYRCDDCR